MRPWRVSEWSSTLMTILEVAAHRCRDWIFRLSSMRFMLTAARWNRRRASIDITIRILVNWAVIESFLRNYFRYHCFLVVPGCISTSIFLAYHPSWQRRSDDWKWCSRFTGHPPFLLLETPSHVRTPSFRLQYIFYCPFKCKLQLEFCRKFFVTGNLFYILHYSLFLIL